LVDRRRLACASKRTWPVLAFALLAATMPALAMQAPESSTGAVSVDKVLRDPDFGVSTRQPGLQRHVEMYQWTRAGDGYALAWRGARVDSSGFAAGHDNPKAMPLREREWRATVRVDGKPLPDAIVARLGEWKAFRPNFSALPGNMSATFQPEGDGLGSADNPLQPRVGDLRVTWRAFVLPPLADRLVLENDAWRLREATVAPTATGPAPQAGPQPQSRHPPTWVFIAAAIVALLGLVVALRKWRRGKQET
jgi:hypothetical protein